MTKLTCSSTGVSYLLSLNFLFQGLSLHVLMLIPGDVPAVLYRSPFSALEEHRVDLSAEVSGQRYLKLVSELSVAVSCVR